MPGSFTESLGLPGGCLVWEGEEQLSQYPAEAGLSFTECWAHIPHNLVVMGHCEGTGAQSKDLCGVGGASAGVSTSSRDVSLFPHVQPLLSSTLPSLQPFLWSRTSSPLLTHPPYSSWEVILIPVTFKSAITASLFGSVYAFNPSWEQRHPSLQAPRASHGWGLCQGHSPAGPSSSG